jgi:drug/metabolite transporter (DMT)-like permease
VNSKKDFLFIVILIIAMISWGISWTSAKIMGQYINPTTAIFTRFLISAITFLPIFTVLKKRLSLKLISLKTVTICAIILAFYNYCFFRGTQLGFAGAGGVLVTTTNPIITMALMAMINKRKLSIRKTIGIFIGLVGGCLILNVWQLGVSQIVQSENIYFILCATIWAVLTIFISKFVEKSQSINFIFWMYLGVSIIMIPFVEFKNIIALSTFDSTFWIHFTIVSVGALTFGTTTYFVASQQLGPEKSSSFIFTVPISAMLTSMIILNEVLTITTLIGCCLTIFAVIIINKSS